VFPVVFLWSNLYPMLCVMLSSVSTEEASWSDFVLTTHVQLSLSIQATVQSRIVVDKGLTNSVAK
jgi:hypothetical protein